MFSILTECGGFCQYSQEASQGHVLLLLSSACMHHRLQIWCTAVTLSLEGAGGIRGLFSVFLLHPQLASVSASLCHTGTPLSISWSFFSSSLWFVTQSWLTRVQMFSVPLVLSQSMCTGGGSFSVFLPLLPLAAKLCLVSVAGNRWKRNSVPPSAGLPLLCAGAGSWAQESFLTFPWGRWFLHLSHPQKQWIIALCSKWFGFWTLP